VESAISGIVVERSRETPIRDEYDVVVVGGGPAGISAAVAAARKGNATLLVERYGFLGGAGTMSGLSNFCGLHAKIHGVEHRQVVHGIVDDLLARIDRFEGLAAMHPGLWRQDHGAGLRHGGVQARRRRSPAIRASEHSLSRFRRRRRDAERDQDRFS
jgi:choline dehydrogenase-like flavoprotein